MDDDTQAIADARDTRALVLSTVLRVAGRVLDKVEEDAELIFGVVGEELPAGGFTWKLSASCGDGRDFVRVVGNPEPDDRGPLVPVEVMAQIMGNHAASFDFQVPREWVRLALKGAAEFE